jgi:signal transduction histidine kinase/ActR/RegA family two-component response regulator
MGALLRPAAIFMNRLRYPAKFSLIGLMFVLPLVLVLFNFLREIDTTISIASQERTGIAANRTLMRLYGDLLRNANAFAAADVRDQERMDTARKQIDADIGAADAAIRSHGSWLGINAHWDRIRQNWDDLREPPKSMETGGRIGAYDDLLSSLVALVSDVGVQSKLFLDPEPASYYVMDTLVSQVPVLTLNLAQSRQYATSINSAARAIDPVQLAERKANMTTAIDVMQFNLSEAYAAQPRLRATLGPAAQVLDSTERQYSDLLSAGIIDSHGPPVSNAAFVRASASLLEAALSYNEVATNQLDDLLLQRIDGVSLRRQAVCWSAALSLALAVYLFGGFYVGTLGGMRHLLETAQRIAKGDYQSITAYGRQDEIGRVAADLEALVRRRTEELVEARNAAEAANVAKSHFLANMSHELRTPLNAVLGFSNLLQSDSSIGNAHKGTLSIINRSGEHLLSLINDVLDVARIEAGRMVIEIAPFDLMEMMRDLTDMMRIRAEEKRLVLIYDESSRFPRFIRSDAAKIRQILINLLGNGVKYTEQGSVTLRVSAETAGASSGAAGTRVGQVLGRTVSEQRTAALTHSGAECVLAFEITDTGSGIAPEDQTRMFEPFVQLTTSADRQGTGLGLAITKQYVELLGGTIDVQSAENAGTRISVWLPVELADASDVRATHAARGHVVSLGPDQGIIRVLIIEDQPENSLLLERLLTGAGFQVRIAENGLIALEEFQTWQPHFIWMDRRMPVMDGIETTRKIREMPGGQDVRIAGLSASTLQDQRAESLASGMDDFVGKPYRPNEIFECMARHLGIAYTFDDAAMSAPRVPSMAADGNVRPGSETNILTAVALMSLAPDVRQDLADALDALDVDRVEDVIRRISEIDPPLGATLAELAGRLAYTAMIKALSPVPEPAAVESVK